MSSPAVPSDDLAAIRWDRAQTELRHGRPIVVRAADRSMPDLLAASVETLSAARFAALAAYGPPRLLLTAERLDALHRPGGLAQSFELPPAVRIEALQHLAAVMPGPIDARLLESGRPAGPAMQAALALIKGARLTPALAVVEVPAARRAELDAAPWLAIDAPDAAAEAERPAVRLRRVSDARVPIASREDTALVLFREIDGDAEHVAVIFGRPDVQSAVPVRLHSSCITGDLLGSLRCDCGDQLQKAVAQLSESGGVLLYLSQEGRGTGLASKLRAYRLQDRGLDTIDADRYLGFHADERDFGAAVEMLRHLGIGRIRLLTNNPRKIDSMRRGGIEVVDRIALIAPVNAHNVRYLQAKRDRAGHMVPVGSPPAPAQPRSDLEDLLGQIFQDGETAAR